MPGHILQTREDPTDPTGRTYQIHQIHQNSSRPLGDTGPKHSRSCLPQILDLLDEPNLQDAVHG